MTALKLTQIGNSVGVMAPYDPDFEAQMPAARQVMKKRRNALSELAK